MRDIPFWFSFMAIGTLIGISETGSSLHNMRVPMSSATLLAFMIYAAVRLFSLGDAADYDSIAFFGYAALLCCWLFTVQLRSPWLAAIGSGSYFIYLWHIFIVMMLRDHTALRQLDGIAGFAVCCGLTVLLSTAALLAVRQLASPRLCRWLGA